MAKMKTYMVPVTITRTVHVMVDARRPKGAVERLQTEEGWREATAYDDEVPAYFDPKRMVLGEPKVMS